MPGLPYQDEPEFRLTLAEGLDVEASFAKLENASSIKEAARVQFEVRCAGQPAGAERGQNPLALGWAFRRRCIWRFHAAAFVEASSESAYSESLSKSPDFTAQPRRARRK
jgi:hypothetical protein